MMTTTDHDWTQEQIAAQLAGGLAPAERDRFTQHIAACGECAATWSEAQSIDKDLNELFEPVRPSPTLEGRVIEALRTRSVAPAPMKRSFLPSRILWWHKAAMAAAAALVVGVMGFVVDGLESGQFGPGERDEAVVMAPPRKPAAPIDGLTGGLALDSDMPSAEKLARQSIEESVFALSEAEGKNRGYTETRRLAAELDQENFRKEKGATRSWGPGQSDAPASKPMPPSSDPVADHYESITDNSKVLDAKRADYFQPGEKAELAKKDLEKAMKELDPAPNPSPKPQPGHAQEDRREKQDKQDPQPQQQRKIIRNGEMEFEVDTFDGALATITKIVSEEGGYIATTNSDKLANGKMRGVVVVRVAPDRLETLVLKMRGIGELKSQRVTSEDVTKQFYDLESRLRAARTMEARLLEIIKTGKGEIKDLLQVEKELAEWRTKIEEYEGTLRYLTNMVSLSTLTLTLTEKNIRTPATSTERENVTMSLEVEDVEKQYNAALAAIADKKGRVTRSELKKFHADQMQGVIQFEVPFEASFELREALKMLGIVASLDIDRSTSQSGEGKPVGELKREDSRYTLSVYNVANIQPRESTSMSVATSDAEKTYKDILARVAKAGGRIVTSTLNRQRNDQTTGRILFEVKAGEADAVKTDVQSGVEVMRLATIENPDTRNTTKSKKGFDVTIYALGAVQARELQSVQLAATNVVSGYSILQDAVQKAGGRILNANLNEQDKHNVTAFVDFEVRRSELPGVEAAMKAVGDVYTRTAQRAQDQENVVDSKLRVQLTLINAAAIPAREMWTLGVEVRDVDKAMADVAAMGQLVGRHQSKSANGQVVAKVILNVPLKRAAQDVERVKALGTLRVLQASKNDQVPDTDLAVARLEVTLSNAELIIPSDEGLWKQVKDGLARSFHLGIGSLKLIFIGLCVLLPWLGLAWIGWKIAARVRRPAPPPAA